MSNKTMFPHKIIYVAFYNVFHKAEQTYNKVNGTYENLDELEKYIK